MTKRNACWTMWELRAGSGQHHQKEEDMVTYRRGNTTTLMGGARLHHDIRKDQGRVIECKVIPEEAVVTRPSAMYDAEMQWRKNQEESANDEGRILTWKLKYVLGKRVRPSQAILKYVASCSNVPALPYRTTLHGIPRMSSSCDYTLIYPPPFRLLPSDSRCVLNRVQIPITVFRLNSRTILSCIESAHGRI